MKNIIIVLSLYFTLCSGQDYTTYTYQTHLKTKLGSFKAGENIIIIENNINPISFGSADKEFIQPEEQRRRLISQSTITNKFIKSFYSMQDSIHMELNYDFSFRQIYKSIQENNKSRKRYISIVRPDSIYSSKMVDTVRTKYNIKTPKVPVYDALGIIFSFQNINELEINKRYNFLEYRRGILNSTTLAILNQKIIKSPYGNILCFELSSGNTIQGKKKGDIKIWISNDDKQIPVKIETETKKGTLILVLESIE